MSEIADNPLLAVGAIALLCTLGFAIFRAGAWYNAVNVDRSEFRAFVKEIRDKFERILERLHPTQTVRPGSPLQLTELGEEISGSFNVKQWAQIEARKLIANIGDKEAFEIFEMCIAHVKTLLEEADGDLEKRLRTAAYDHGINTEEVRKVYEVELRDAVIKFGITLK